MDSNKQYDFLSFYHCSVYEAVADDAVMYNAKIGTIMAYRFLKTVPIDQPCTHAQLKQMIETNLAGKFRFSESTSIDFKAGDTISVHINGCAIYDGNELLKTNGKQIFCPICHMFRAILQQGLKSKITLTGIVKPGATGECYLNYKTN